MAGAGDLRDVLSKYGVSSLNEKTDGGWTALMNAVAVSDKTSVEILLDNGADPEITDGEGRTALHLAAGFAITDMTWLLLERGVNMEAVDGRGFTPLLAAKNGEEEYKGSESGKLYTEVRRMLEVKAADRKKPGVSLVKAPSLTDVFNKYGVKSVDEPTKTGWTPLMFAVVTEDYAGARVLIENGADIEARDSQRRTPLFIAVENEKPEMVRLLLEKGADRDTQNFSGRTPLLYAQMRDGTFGNTPRGKAISDIIRLLKAAPAQMPRKPGYLSSHGRRWTI